MILSTLSLIRLPISYFLFNLGFPPYTLSIVYLIISIINFAILQILLKLILNFDIYELFLKVYLKILFVILLITPLFFIPNLVSSSFIRFCTLSSFSIFWIIVVIYLVGMSKDEKSTLNSIKLRIIH